MTDQLSATSPAPLTQLQIDQRVFDLYDEYCHGHMDRRSFFAQCAAIAGGLAMAQALIPNYARAQTISFTDSRIKGTYVTYDSPGGNSGQMRGYLVQPTTQGPFGTVLVIHENRGLNPYIEDVARRAAAEGFLALAPDGLHPLGGYPGNDDDGRALQTRLDQAKLRTDMLNSAKWLKAHALSNGKLGVTGFCWGGKVVWQACARFAVLDAGVAWYGRLAPAATATPEQAAAGRPWPVDLAGDLKCPVLGLYGGQDRGIPLTSVEAMRAALQRAGQTAGGIHVYPDAPHAFHADYRDSYRAADAADGWSRMLAIFNERLKR